MSSRTPGPSVSLRPYLCNCCVGLWLFSSKTSSSRTDITWVRAVHPRNVQFIGDPKLGTEYCLRLRICIQVTHNSMSVFIHLLGHALNSRAFPVWTWHIRASILCLYVVHTLSSILLPPSFSFQKKNWWMFNSAVYSSVIWGLSICFVFLCLWMFWACPARQDFFLSFIPQVLDAYREWTRHHVKLAHWWQWTGGAVVEHRGSSFKGCYCRWGRAERMGVCGQAGSDQTDVLVLQDEALWFKFRVSGWGFQGRGSRNSQFAVKTGLELMTCHLG